MKGLLSFQSPQSGQCLCSFVKGLGEVEVSAAFSPLSRGNASAATRATSNIWCWQNLSVPSVGAMPLQQSLIVDVVKSISTFSPLSRGNASAAASIARLPGVWKIFQSPQSGQCLCSLTGLVFFSLTYGFQSPQSGQCLCSTTLHLRSQRLKSFQSPQSGQCLCSSACSLIWFQTSLLSVPSVGAMPLQRYLPMFCLSPLATFSPLSRGNASAALCG